MSDSIWRVCVQKLYSASRLGSSGSDLCMIVASLSKVKLTEVIVEKDSDAEKELGTKLANWGLTLSYPVLETAEGVLLTQSSAIAQYIAASGKATHLLGCGALQES